MAVHTPTSSLHSGMNRRCQTLPFSVRTEIVSPRVKNYSFPARRYHFSNLVQTHVAEADVCTHIGSKFDDDVVGRRQVFGGVAALVAAFSTIDNEAQAAGNAPKGYATVLDNVDGYSFVYPFGWQEVSVKGQDVAYKDVIEPLESVSVSIVETDKSTVQDLGSPDEVAKALIERVLASSSQKTKLVQAKERSTDGKKYYTFEFLAKAQNYTRHALGAVTISNGKFFTLTTGANERRWSKMEDKLRFVIDSFVTL